MALQKKISREKLRARKDHIFTALVEGPSKDNPLVWEARLESMAPDIDGKLYLTDIELPSGQIAAMGDIVQVEIIKTDAYDLIGRVTEIRTPAALAQQPMANVPPPPSRSSPASPPAQHFAS
jgi:tRNA A37 methylthiotransferase MiaB